MNQPGSSNRIEPTPVRISTNLTIDRQTPKSDFGDRLAAGLQTVGGAIASGAAVVAPLVPGSAIVSAAVSSVSQLGSQLAQGAGAAPAATYTSGLVGLGTGGTGINTTVGGGAPAPVGNVGVGGGGGLGGGLGGVGAGGLGGGLGGGGGAVNGVPSNASGLETLQRVMNANNEQNVKLLGLQMNMQRENLVFSTVSNVLKTRHDTVKNTISNVR